MFTENVKKDHQLQVEAKPKTEKKQLITVNVENESYHQQKIKSASAKLENVPYHLLNEVFPPSPRQALSTIQSVGLKQQAVKLQPVQCKPIKRHRKVSAHPNSKKNKFGKINSGVGHGIRKPKKTKPVSTSIKQQLIERFSKKWKKKPEEYSETVNDFEAIWNSDESEGNTLQQKVANIVEHLEIDEPEEIVTSEEQLDKIVQLMKTVQNMQDDNLTLDAEKVKEVDELLEILLGASPLPVCEQSESQAMSDTKNSPVNNKIELPGTSSSGSDCEALELPTQEEVEKLRQMEELMSQLDNSSYTDPDDTDPFADDDDESIVTSTSNEISQGTSTNTQNSELPMIVECDTDTTQEDKFSLDSQETGSSNVPSTVDSNEMDVCDSTETSAKDSDSELESLSKNVDCKTLVAKEIENDVNMENEQCDEISNKESDSMDFNEENTECPSQNDKSSKLGPTKEVELQQSTDGLTENDLNLPTNVPVSSNENIALDQTVTEQINDTPMETPSKLESIAMHNPSAGETFSTCDLFAKMETNIHTPELKQVEVQIECCTPENSIKVYRTAYFTALHKDPNDSSNDSFFSAESSPIISSKPPTPKLFSIFMKGSPSNSTKSSSPLLDKQQRPQLPAKDHGSKEQLLLDAGQKKFGVDSCVECGFVYDPDCRSDVTAHLAFHNRHETQLKHLGWKNERVLIDFKNGGRIIMVQPGDPTAWWRRVATILETVNNDLGFIEDIIDFKNIKYKVFMYIYNKSVVSCVVAESMSVANKLLPGSEELCSTEFFSATCGITRIWTSKQHRRKGYAAKLMDREFSVTPRPETD
ncbi:hypothetical protein B566_EDAN002567 [Ephemera danica]|nr:hypothetical protein B566_EDAN002567 [Ephemera danica]